MTDSFFKGLLGYPEYTRPKVFDKMEVPSVLLSGNHKSIKEWRLKQSLGRTWERRPEMLKNKNLTNEEKKLLHEFKNEFF